MYLNFPVHEFVFRIRVNKENFVHFRTIAYNVNLEITLYLLPYLLYAVYVDSYSCKNLLYGDADWLVVISLADLQLGVKIVFPPDAGREILFWLAVRPARSYRP